MQGVKIRGFKGSSELKFLYVYSLFISMGNNEEFFEFLSEVE